MACPEHISRIQGLVIVDPVSVTVVSMLPRRPTRPVDCVPRDRATSIGIVFTNAPAANEDANTVLLRTLDLFGRRRGCCISRRCQVAAVLSPVQLLTMAVVMQSANTTP